MSSLKRKDAPGGHPSAKAAKTSKTGKPLKRDGKPKDGGGSTDKNKLSGELSAAPSSSIVTRLGDEEPLFPRGGGGVLTPLERKQINLEAKADALQDGLANSSSTVKSKKKKRTERFGSRGGKKKDGAHAAEEQIKIESLNYKKLVRGAMVLCQIVQIASTHLTVALPNNLIGQIPITHISDALTSRLQDKMEEDDVEEEDDEEPSLDLQALFRIGQYLRAQVSSTIDDAEANALSGRRRIGLSIKPTDTNAGLSASDVVPNTTVMASVASVEDHGCVMDLGIQGLSGFLPRKEVDPAIAEGALQEGAVLLCVAISKKAAGNVVQLTTLPEKIGNMKSFPTTAATINSFLPGTLVELLVTLVTSHGFAGKVIGHLDVTADLIHSGAGPSGINLEDEFKIGAKIKARVICNFPSNFEPKLGVSLLPHVMSLRAFNLENEDNQISPLDQLPISSVVEKCVVRTVDPDVGLFVDVGVPRVPGFVHISRVQDDRIEALYATSGRFKVDSVHRGRIVSYNPMDGLFGVSFEQSTLEQKYLRVDDVPIGDVVSCVIQRLVVGTEGVSALVVSLEGAKNISGWVPALHFADVQLKHPERMFTEGKKVKARVISIDRSSNQITLTLKKTLVNSDLRPVTSADQLADGMKLVVWIVKVMPKGAAVRSYGSVKGFLPISQMSEARISDPTEHFHRGQALIVHVLKVPTEVDQLIVSCKDPSAFGLEKQAALRSIMAGSFVSAKVTEKIEDGLSLELLDSGLRATLPVGHLSDDSLTTNQSKLKRVKVGQELSSLMVFSKHEVRRTLILTQKPSFIDGSRTGELLTNLADAQIGQQTLAVVENTVADGVALQLAGGILTWIRKSHLPISARKEPNFGLQKHQTVRVRITAVNYDKGTLAVALADDKPKLNTEPILNPVDISVVTLDDVAFGRTVMAKVAAVHDTQLDVKIADNMQGRIDVSQVFDSWDEIPDPLRPLSKFRTNNLIRVRVIGLHQRKDHRFLPFSHRSTSSVLELSAKRSDIEAESLDIPSYEKLQVGSTYTAFVNNVTDTEVWVHLSPNVRGRISALEAFTKVPKDATLAAHFAIGSALRARVLSVDVEKKRAVLSARSLDSTNAITWETLKTNAIMFGRVIKVDDRQVVVQLADKIAGTIQLVDVGDDYDHASTLLRNKGDMIRVSIVDVDRNNKKIRLSTRASRILSSSSPITDREITAISQLAPGDLVRGFVKNVSDTGLFVTLGGSLVARVKIGNLFDEYVKHWRDRFQIAQLVKGRILSVSKDLGQIEFGLKPSQLKDGWTKSAGYEDIKAGQIVTGKVRKVEEFGAFIDLDGTNRISGLCHRSEMAENPVDDARKLYKSGDVVKTKVLDVDIQKRRITLGLKPSYFEDKDENTGDDSDSSDDDGSGVSLNLSKEALDATAGDSNDMLSLQGTKVRVLGTDNNYSSEDDAGSDEDAGNVDDAEETLQSEAPMAKYDWAANAFDDSADEMDADESVAKTMKRKKRTKAEIQVDMTGKLDVDGPQQASDFERLLIGQPDSSTLWISYMAFQMQVSELAKAREIAERAISTINIREETEKLNVWIAYLNLEVAYGTRQTVEDVFKRACQYNNEQEIYERLTSIYIQSSKHKAADELFEALVKKFGSKSPTVWTNYAHFLHTTMNAPGRARLLLPRAVQALDTRHHIPLTSRFAALEFRSPKGNPEQGRTLFEGLLASAPKKFDIWNQLVDLEIGRMNSSMADGSVGSQDETAVRDVFERGSRVKGLKPRQAEKWFRRWAEWEERRDPKGREKVMAQAQEWAASAKARKAAGGQDPVQES